MKIRYRAGPEIGFVVENLDEVNARSVPKTADTDGSSVKLSSSSTKAATIVSSASSKSASTVVASGVLPPKAFKYPSVSTPLASSTNTHETVRYHKLLNGMRKNMYILK